MDYVLFTYYVPVEYEEIVADACFQAGAGVIGNYQKCCWKIKGKGQFQALAAANPFVGKVNQLHVEDELKVEMVCKTSLINAVEQTFLEAHPYETPVYFFISANKP